MKRAFWIWNVPQCENGDPLKIAAIVIPPADPDRLARIEKKLVDLEKVLLGLSTIISDMQSTLSK